MKQKINKCINEINSIEINTPEESINFQNKYLSKKGVINTLFIEFKSLPGDQKRILGKELNNLKNIALAKFELAGKTKKTQTPQTKLDLTMPPGI